MTHDECFVWKGARIPTGYGQKLVNGVVKYTHRIAYEWANGPIPEGLLVLHKCDNPPCCNPDHLFLGTAKDNMQDCMKKGRFATTNARGENNKFAKFHDGDIRVIRNLYEDGVRQCDIATFLDISACDVWHIIHRKTWRHVQ